MKAYSFIGTNIRLWGYQSTTTDEYVRTNATLIKFDADAFEINRSDQYYANGRYAHGSGSGKVNSFTRYFAGRSSNWESTQEMSDTLINSEDLYYYSDLDDLEGDGYTCVGVLYIADVENINTSSQSYGMIGLTVKDDSALIGNVYAACNDSWASYSTQEELAEKYGAPVAQEGGTINTAWARNGYNLYKAYCSLSAYKTMKTTIESGNNGDYWYHKTEYGSDGNITGGHNVGYYGGTSLLICGEKCTVEIQTDSQLYDLDSGQRTTYVTVTPTVTVDGNASSGTGDKGTTTTTATVKVTLPADLTYDEGTAYWGDTAITPVVTVNDDGSTVLTFTLENVTVGDTLDALTFSCTIGHAGTAEDVTNNQEIELNATIESTNDHRAKEESFGNSSTTSFDVIKLSATSISKSVDNRMIELNGSFTWTLNFFNGGTSDMSGAVMADVFPANGVMGSSFSGNYTISEIEIDFSKAPNSYNDDDEIMDFYVSNEYSGSGSDLAKGGIPTGDGWYDLIDGSESDDPSERIISLSVPDDYADSLKAFYFYLGNLDSVETVIIRVYVQTKGNDPGDIYNNLFYESSSDQETPVQSNLVSTQVVQRNISGRTWYDVNDNGLQDSGENSTPDVTVTLYGEDGVSEVTDVYGNIVEPQVTGENGSEKGAYSFENLPAGTYRVEFSNVHSEVYELAKRNVGTNDTIDSDAKLVSTDNDDLIAEITGISLPAIADMDRYLYESNYNDAGYVMKYVDVEGEKIWEDDEDRDGNRPESIIIRLLADGVEIDHVTVTPDADGKWSWSFKDLPRGNEEGIKITYTVTEDAIYHYQSEYDGYNVTNVHSPSTTSLTVVKAWDDRDDQDGIRPGSITIELLADGEETGKTLILASSSNWQGTFKDLYIYHDEGEEYKYTIKEIDAPPGYEAVISGNPSSGYVVTNTHTSERIDIPVSKVWRDNDDEYEDRPHSVTVALLADGEATGDRLTLDDSNDWSGVFKDKYTYYYGREIVYGVEEVTDDALKDYKPKVTKIEDESGYSFEITNYRAYFPIDEEIVTNQDDIFDRDNWKKNESVNEYNAIRFEMTTKLPYMDIDEVKAGEVTLNFHEILDSDLVLDETETQFMVYIAEHKIDAQYYKVTISPDDECSFHVDVDLTSLCKDGIVSEDDLENNAEITIFFFADLEGTGLNGSYKSTIWYDIYDGGTWLYTSNESVVEVYTYEINVIKYDSSKLKGTDYAAAGLAGATLGVYYDIDCKEPVIRRGEAYTVTSGDGGSAMFYGLAAGTYYVKETKAPKGYRLSSTVMIAILDETLNNDTDYYTYNGHYGNTPSSSGGGGGGGGGSTGGSGTVVGGPGDSYDSEGESWDLSPLAGTGQGRAMLFGTCALAISAMALIVLLFFKRRERK